jgi:hypothetical protein
MASFYLSFIILVNILNNFIIIGEKALSYFDPPTSYYGGQYSPNLKGNTLAWARCWPHSSGVVCSDCYHNQGHLLAQMSIICPMTSNTCEYIMISQDLKRFKINPNQCIIK